MEIVKKRIKGIKKGGNTAGAAQYRKGGGIAAFFYKQKKYYRIDYPVICPLGIKRLTRLNARRPKRQK
ncbi:MAG: hypothetical protein GX061_01750 [Eubacteriaceae bacterium]|nr:hypothetical protein [Eubacteriaceae bacterium]